MPIAKPRNRIVVFRLTQEEYRVLKGACRAKGGRNLSEFTRSELMTLLGFGNVATTMHARCCSLEEKLSPLQRAVAQLTEMFIAAGFKPKPDTPSEAGEAVRETLATE